MEKCITDLDRETFYYFYQLIIYNFSFFLAAIVLIFFPILLTNYIVKKIFKHAT